MKRFLIVLSVILAGVALQGQNIRGSGAGNQKMTKEERKAARAAEEEMRIKEVAAIMNDTLFVLQADRVFSPGNDAVVVDPGLNFMAVSKDVMVLQTGSGYPKGIMDNSLGGVTIPGHLTSYKLITNKKGYYQVKANFRGSTAKNYRIDMSISPSGNTVARVTEVSGSWLEFRGRVKAVEDARIFKGIVTF